VKRVLLSRGSVLVGLLVVSLSLYWAAEAGSTPVQIIMLGLLIGLSLLAVRPPK
jgi:hypothetical protein